MPAETRDCARREARIEMPEGPSAPVLRYGRALLETGLPFAIPGLAYHILVRMLGQRRHRIVVSSSNVGPAAVQN